MKKRVLFVVVFLVSISVAAIYVAINHRSEASAINDAQLELFMPAATHNRHYSAFTVGSSLFDSFTLRTRDKDGKIRSHFISVRGTNVHLVEDCNVRPLASPYTSVGGYGRSVQALIPLRTGTAGLSSTMPTIPIPDDVKIYSFDAKTQQYVRLKANDALTQGKGYFISSTRMSGTTGANYPLCLTFRGDVATNQSDLDVQLLKGWNFIGAPSIGAPNINNIFASRPSGLTKIDSNGKRIGIFIPKADSSAAKYISSNAYTLNILTGGFVGSLPTFTDQYYPSGWPIGEGVVVYANEPVALRFETSVISYISNFAPAESFGRTKASESPQYTHVDLPTGRRFGSITDITALYNATTIAQAQTVLQHFADGYRLQLLSSGTGLGDAPFDETDLARLKDYGAAFIDEWAKYPTDWILNSGLTTVVIAKDLGVNTAATWSPYNHTMFYSTDWGNGEYARSVIHHEFAHLLESSYFGFPIHYPNQLWESYNPTAFRYSGNAESINPVIARTTHPTPGFVTGYAATTLEEDRAEIYSYLMTAGRYKELMKWLPSDTVLGKKVQLYKDFMASHSATMTGSYFDDINP